MGMPTAIKCKYCAQAANPIDIYFEIIAAYNNHINKVHNKTNPSDYVGTACKCHICNNYFDDCATYQAHLQAEHNQP